MNEAFAISIICAMLGGEPETRHYYDTGIRSSYVQVDCETDRYVIEVGLDKRSSLDSLQQTLFASNISEKEPMIVVVDTDNEKDIYEYRIGTTAKELGIPLLVFKSDLLE